MQNVEGRGRGGGKTRRIRAFGGRDGGGDGGLLWRDGFA